MNVTVDEAIERVEKLYATVTGSAPPPVSTNAAQISPELDPRVVEQRLSQLLSVTERLVAEPAGPTWMPHASIIRAAGSTDLLIDLPGVAGDQLQIHINEDLMTVTGRRDLPPGAQVEMSDVPVGRFARTFRLPTKVAPKQVVARLTAGVLTVRISEERGESSQVSKS